MKKVLLAGLVNAAFGIFLIMLSNTPASFLRALVISAVLYLFAVFTHVIILASKDGLLFERDLEENISYVVVDTLPLKSTSSSTFGLNFIHPTDTVVLLRKIGQSKIYAVAMSLEGRELPWVFKKKVTQTKATNTKIDYIPFDAEGGDG